MTRGIREPRYHPQPFRPCLIRRIGQVLLTLPRGQKLHVSGPERLEIVERPVGVVDVRTEVQNRPVKGFRGLGGQQARKGSPCPLDFHRPLRGLAQSGEHLRNHLVSCQIHSTVLPRAV